MHRITKLCCSLVSLFAATLQGSTLCLATAEPVQTKQPRGRVDQIFLRIPARYAYGLSVKARRELLNSTGRTTIDDPNGYLSISGDAASPGFTLALFKRSDGRYLTGIVSFDEVSQEMHLLEQEGQTWRDVTRQYVPSYSRHRFYWLPQIGRVIEVKNEDGEKVGTLTWNGVSFVAELKK